MEYRDLYDENRTPLFKTIKKGEKPTVGMYYVSVAIAIENDDGTFLLQKRAENKGGLWATTSGHPKSGETSLEGIVTEIKEEMGLSIPKDKIKLFKTVKTNDDFVDFYYIKLHILKEKIHLQKEEVSDYMFATKDEILKLIEHNKFYHSHAKMMLDCFEYLENGISR
jgi:isopentenyldiphosphate isomerase